MANVTTIRSSHQKCFIKKGIRKNFAKFTGKHLCQSLFFNKIVVYLISEVTNNNSEETEIFQTHIIFFRTKTLHKKCPYSELFSGDTEYLSVFSPIAGKYGPE